MGTITPYIHLWSGTRILRQQCADMAVGACIHREESKDDAERPKDVSSLGFCGESIRGWTLFESDQHRHLARTLLAQRGLRK